VLARLRVEHRIELKLLVLASRHFEHQICAVETLNNWHISSREFVLQQWATTHSDLDTLASRSPAVNHWTTVGTIRRIFGVDECRRGIAAWVARLIRIGADVRSPRFASARVLVVRDCLGKLRSLCWSAFDGAWLGLHFKNNFND